jgi:hypothetical protein
MDKNNQTQDASLLDQLFESTKKLIIDNLELAATATNESMRSYYEGMALGAYCLFCSHSPLNSPEYQEVTDIIGVCTDLEVKA